MKIKTNNINAYVLRSLVATLLFSCAVVAICSAINPPHNPSRSVTPENNSVLAASSFTGSLVPSQSSTATQPGPNFAVNTIADTDDGACDSLGQGTGNQDCTLREAINAANVIDDGSTITFSVSGTIVLGSQLPAVNRSITIDGTGQSVEISGNDSVNIFIIFNNFKTLNLNALTISHARNNSFGGLFLRYASANITNCTFNDNYNTGSLGGAIWGNEASHLVVANSTFYNNKAPYGAGIHVAGVPNGAPSSLFVYNCTFFNNQITAGGLTLRAVDIDAVDATAEVRNSVLVTDATPGHAIWVNCQGITAGSNNIDNRGFCGESSFPSAEQINLGTLQYNGGPTKTVALLPGSVAIDAADNTTATAQDQRYYLRSGVPDSGAFEFGGTLAPASASSRKTHGAAGPFDVGLPLTGPAGIECRAGGATGDHQLILTFPAPVTVNGTPQAQVTTGIGQIGTGGISDGGIVTLNATGTVATVPLTNVTDAQSIVVTLFSVNDGVNTNNVTIPLGLLLGDVSGNGSVNASDISLTKAQAGQPLTQDNFREDVTANGSINASDVSLVKAHSGTSVP
jgi:CSLREA domain-containing protein